MRQITITLQPTDDPIHPVSQQLANEPSITREYVHYLNRQPDGTSILLYQARGAVTEIEPLLDASPAIHEYFARPAGDKLQLYLHFDPNGTISALLELLDSNRIALVLPITCTPSGGFRVTAVGPEAELDNTLDMIPESIDLTVDAICEFRPDRAQAGFGLTNRQLEIVSAAVQEGYYDVPKEASCADVAERVGLSQATVGEHLQKIESRVLRSVVASSNPPGGAE